MTNEEIIQIAHKYLYHYDTELGQWEMNEESIEDIIEFARAIHENGYSDGYEQCSIDMGDENV
jgi:hypothetical protein